ncbi:MAG: GNAT family N-acetyltransferase [Myxococcota bacterium]|nr:GNAT family N-acetyltransferase [Myxococcota bacterium]
MLMTDRLSLEPFRPTHVDALFQALQAKELYTDHRGGPPETREALEGDCFLLKESRRSDGVQLFLKWIISLSCNRRPVGYFEATIDGHGRSEIGYVIFPAYWRQGYASECVKYMVRHLIRRHDLTTVTATVGCENRGSIKVLEQAGLVKVALEANGSDRDRRQRHDYVFVWSHPPHSRGSADVLSSLDATTPSLVYFRGLVDEVRTAFARDGVLEGLNTLARTRRMHRPKTPSFVTLRGRLKAVQYHRHIAEQQEVPLETGSQHDGWNVLTWLAFPATKLALMNRHCQAYATRSTCAPGRRSVEEDTLTHFDESGIIVLTTSRTVIRRIRSFEWKTLFWTERESFLATTRVLVFGHGLAQKLTDPFLGLVGHARLELVAPSLLDQPDSTLIRFADERVAEGLERGHTFRSMRTLHPLPLLGVPGFWPEKQDAAFYDNPQYFRAKKRRHGHPK